MQTTCCCWLLENTGSTISECQNVISSILRSDLHAFKCSTWSALTVWCISTQLPLFWCIELWRLLIRPSKVTKTWWGKWILGLMMWMQTRHFNNSCFCQRTSHIEQKSNQTVEVVGGYVSSMQRVFLVVMFWMNATGSYGVPPCTKPSSWKYSGNSWLIGSMQTSTCRTALHAYIICLLFEYCHMCYFYRAFIALHYLQSITPDVKVHKHQIVFYCPFLHTLHLESLFYMMVNISAILYVQMRGNSVQSQLLSYSRKIVEDFSRRGSHIYWTLFWQAAFNQPTLQINCEPHGFCSR